MVGQAIENFRSREAEPRKLCAKTLVDPANCHAPSPHPVDAHRSPVYWRFARDGLHSSHSLPFVAAGASAPMTPALSSLRFGNEAIADPVPPRVCRPRPVADAAAISRRGRVLALSA